MSEYDRLMQKYDDCIGKARQARDTNLRRFYYNVAQGYEMQAKALTLEDAAAPVKTDGVQP